MAEISCLMSYLLSIRCLPRRRAVGIRRRLVPRTSSPAQPGRGRGSRPETIRQIASKPGISAAVIQSASSLRRSPSGDLFASAFPGHEKMPRRCADGLAVGSPSRRGTRRAATAESKPARRTPSCRSSRSGSSGRRMMMALGTAMRMRETPATGCWRPRLACRRRDAMPPAHVRQRPFRRQQFADEAVVRLVRCQALANPAIVGVCSLVSQEERSTWSRSAHLSAQKSATRSLEAVIDELARRSGRLSARNRRARPHWESADDVRETRRRNSASSQRSEGSKLSLRNSRGRCVDEVVFGDGGIGSDLLRARHQCAKDIHVAHERGHDRHITRQLSRGHQAGGIHRGQASCSTKASHA